MINSVEIQGNNNVSWSIEKVIVVALMLSHFPARTRSTLKSVLCGGTRKILGILYLGKKRFLVWAADTWRWVDSGHQPIPQLIFKQQRHWFKTDRKIKKYHIICLYCAFNQPKNVGKCHCKSNKLHYMTSETCFIITMVDKQIILICAMLSWYPHITLHSWKQLQASVCTEH